MGLRSHTGLPLLRSTKMIHPLPGQLLPQSYALLLPLPRAKWIQEVTEEEEDEKTAIRQEMDR